MSRGKFGFALCGWRVGALMALCLLQPAPGHVQLLPPQNVTLLSKDFAMILAWAPGEGFPPNVTYTVRYESQDRLDKWVKVSHCKNIPRTFCNLTCALSNLYVKVRARVKAVWGRSQSPWVKSQFKDYYSDVELAPPELILSVQQDSIRVKASFPLPSCVENLTWKYDLNLWEEGSADKDFSQFKPAGPTFHVELREKELSRDDLSFTEKPKRTNRALGGQNQPRVTALPSSSSEEENEDEDEEDEEIFIFIPYNEMPRHPKSHLSFQPPPTAQGGSRLGLGSGNVSVDTKSVLDLSDLGFSFFPERKDTWGSRTEQEMSCCSYRSSLGGMSLSATGLSGIGDGNGEKMLGMTPFHPLMREIHPRDGNEEKMLGMIPFHPLMERIHPRDGNGEKTLGMTPFHPLMGRIHPRDGNGEEILGMVPFNPVMGEIHPRDGNGEETLGMVPFNPVIGGIHPRDGNGEEMLGMTPFHPLMGGIHTENLPARGEAPEFSRNSQKSDLQPQTDSRAPDGAQDGTLPIPWWSLRVAEDEGIASDCDSDILGEGTPPEPSVLSDALDSSNTEGKHLPKFQLAGYERCQYLGRF
uniref:Fibronectin type-III domain-containing protein n=1 Tax=Malurus cyaneus samueli TaxID=2593467 RepID=A0A8C5T4D5_9PASS